MIATLDSNFPDRLLEEGLMMGFLALAALGAIVWLLYRIDTKLQGIGDMLNTADQPKQLTE